ncbi:MAG: TlpA family protein disulfide reductase [Gammaproteobacteria bacterium]
MHHRNIIIFCAALLFAAVSNGSSAETGRAAPICTLAPVGGTQPYDMRRFRGKVLYVDFWASWCPPCARSFPFMNAMDRELRDRGLQVLGINLDEDPEDAKRFLEKHPASFTVLSATGGQCPQDYGVKAMPSSYLIDRHGVIRYVHLGFRAGEAEHLRARVEALLGESAAGEAIGQVDSGASAP